MDAVEVRADPESFGRVARALDAEAGGDLWDADVGEELHNVLSPAAAQARGALMGMTTAGLDHAGEPLRQAVAHNVVEDVRLGDGPGAGARVRALKNGLPRGFDNAPKRLNQHSFRRRVFGGAWVNQTGAPGWFDDTFDRLRSGLKAAAERALQRRADRIARRS